MKRLALSLGLLTLVACNKPSEESCKKAIENMRKVMGTASYNEDIEPYIRRCRGGSTRASVECAANAKTRDDLLKCEFVHFEDKTPGTGSGSGSGSGSAK